MVHSFVFKINLGKNLVKILLNFYFVPFLQLLRVMVSVTQVVGVLEWLIQRHIVWWAL